MLVINALGNHGRLRFNQMMNELDGISPTPLWGVMDHRIE
jgi:DNA-binding HxlR family transcriptional regulator